MRAWEQYVPGLCPQQTGVWDTGTAVPAGRTLQRYPLPQRFQTVSDPGLTGPERSEKVGFSRKVVLL